jgi:hypothetical protein
MADSTTNLPTIDVNQAQKEVVANALFDAASPATYWGRDFETTGGLTWGYLGGVLEIAGVATRFPNDVITLTASATNYVEVTAAGVVQKNTVGFSYGTVKPLYKIVCNGSGVTSYEDFRYESGGGGVSGSITVEVQDGLSVVGSPVALGGTVIISTPLVNPGDLLVVRQIAGSPTNIFLDRLPVGSSDGEVLTVDSSAERRLSWQPVDVTGGGTGLTLPYNTNPNGPPAGSPSGVEMIAFVDRTGWPALIDQFDDVHPFSDILDGAVSYYFPMVAQTSADTKGGATVTNTGLSAPWASTDRYTSKPKHRNTSAAPVNSNAAHTAGGHMMLRGSAAGAGGFMLEMIWGYNAINATSRYAVGVSTGSSALGASADPSASVNVVWFAMDSADTNWQIMHNDGTGTCTKVDLGAGFPRPTVSVTVYKGRIWCKPGDSVMYYRLQRMDDKSQIASGTVSSNLISATLPLYVYMGMNTGPSTAVAVAQDNFGWWCRAGRHPYTDF